MKTNYETWAVLLRLAGDSDSDAHWRDRVAHLAAEMPVTEGMLRYAVGDVLQEEFEAGGQLEDAATSEVNWAEIAGYFLEPQANV